MFFTLIKMKLTIALTVAIAQATKLTSNFTAPESGELVVGDEKPIFVGDDLVELTDDISDATELEGDAALHCYKAT